MLNDELKTLLKKKQKIQPKSTRSKINFSYNQTLHKLN
jgi:hypothetical protein